MASHSNHLYLMSSNKRHCQFWFNGLGLYSSNYYLMVVNEVLSKNGIKGLSNKIESNIIENEISLLLIEPSSPVLAQHQLAGQTHHVSVSNRWTYGGPRARYAID